MAVKNKELELQERTIHTILVLDEATSALDKKTESNVIDSLKDLPKSLTIIFISHRESSLKLCNKIYDLDKKILKIL